MLAKTRAWSGIREPMRTETALGFRVLAGGCDRLAVIS